MDAIDINSKGWDQPVYSVLGCVLGVGRLMKLTRAQMANAVSLALAPNMALTQTRRGDLSSWKGCAGANASRNAVFAAMLAHEGFTGPTAVFEGEGGLWDIVGRFEWPLPAIPAVPHMIGQTHIKRLPVCYHGQSAVEAALALRSRVKLEDVAGIDVAGYRTAVNMMGNDPSRWAPATRETADHSLPYVIAIALLDGEVTAKSFASARLGDPTVGALMKKVTVTEDAGLSAQYPESSGSRIDVRLDVGSNLDARSPLSEGTCEESADECESRGKVSRALRAVRQPGAVRSGARSVAQSGPCERRRARRARAARVTAG
jgi:2-methylcitrate dehydratase